MVIDIFPFFNELDLLEIRVNELKGVVDRHILVEANRTFTGRPKPLIYQKWADRNGGGYKNVSNYGIVTMPDGSNPWHRENYQCEYAYSIALANMLPGDTLIIGDLDEIPSGTRIKCLTVDEPLALEMTTYSCYLDWLAPNRKTLSPVILPYADAKRPGSWGAIRKANPPFKVEKYAGWHFTDMGGNQRNVDKLTAFSHAPEQGPTESVANILSGKETLFERYKREGCIRQVSVDWLPKYVRDNIPRMIELGLLEQR